MSLQEIDPTGLIAEAYKIEEADLATCRVIFFDWAMGRYEREATTEEVAVLLAHYGADAPDHPMTQILREGLARPEAKGRRGGGRARRP